MQFIEYVNCSTLISTQNRSSVRLRSGSRDANNRTRELFWAFAAGTQKLLAKHCNVTSNYCLVALPLRIIACIID